tara:strand:+ start:43 stop:519 length:477 start_codon:yes stop_codon:yes gene_type:complete
MSIFLTDDMQFHEVYSGGCGPGFVASAAANTNHEIDCSEWNSMPGRMYYVQIDWSNLNSNYGYNVTLGALVRPKSPNTSGGYQTMVHNSHCGFGLSQTYRGLAYDYYTHTATTNLQCYLYMAYSVSDGGTYPPLSLYIQTNYAVSSGAPSMKIFRVIS